MIGRTKTENDAHETTPMPQHDESPAVAGLPYEYRHGDSNTVAAPAMTGLSGYLKA